MNIAPFHRFTDFEDPARLRACLQVECERAGLPGTILVVPPKALAEARGEPQLGAMLD